VRANLLLAALFCGSVAAGAAWAVYRLLTVPVPLSRQITLMIEPGESAGTVASRLEHLGIVRHGGALLLLARYRGVDRSFRQGEHHFEGSVTPDDVLDELVSHTEGALRVTIPEGRTWREIGEILEQSGVVRATDYYAAVCDPELVAFAGAPPRANCAEGFLFPDTYDLAPTMTAADIAKLQVSRFHTIARRVLADIPDGITNVIVPEAVTDGGPEGVLRDEPPQIDLLRTGVTLASVIEKETGVSTERPLVASVFHNRLRRGMRLQADPTVIYGLEISGAPWDRERLHQYLDQPGPYNSYTQWGLPPGPICNPGESALRAAFVPVDSDYLYFVANGDGSHHFSRTLAEHNRAVADARRRTRPTS
jgi:UPF0755 protein